MKKDSTLSIRVNQEIREKAEKIFNDNDINISNAIHLFLENVVNRNYFNLNETVKTKAIEELDTIYNVPKSFLIKGYKVEKLSEVSLVLKNTKDVFIEINFINKTINKYKLNDFDFVKFNNGELKVFDFEGYEIDYYHSEKHKQDIRDWFWEE